MRKWPYFDEYITFFSGTAKDISCEKGLCRPKYQHSYDDTCTDICGKPSCSDIVFTKPCDLSKQLGAFTGDQKTSLNGKTLT